MTRSLTTQLHRLALGVAILATMGLGALPAIAQDDHAEGAGGMPPMGRPAEMDQIAFMQGKWNVEMKMRMGPGTDWMKSDAHAETKAVLNGCAQRMDFEGAVMGMPFHGFDHTTYNRETKRFESVWIDDMGARMSTMYGGFDDDGNFVLMGEDIQNGMKMKTRSTSTKIDDNTVHWIMEMSMDGKTWFQNMDMTYTRAD